MFQSAPRHARLLPLLALLALAGCDYPPTNGGPQSVSEAGPTGGVSAEYTAARD